MLMQTLWLQPHVQGLKVVISRIKSPCIRVCTIKDGLCQGCYRTLDEISKWRDYNEEEKKDILKLIHKRRDDT